MEKLRKQQEEEQDRLTKTLEKQLYIIELQEKLAKKGKRVQRQRRTDLRRQILIKNAMNDLDNRFPEDSSMNILLQPTDLTTQIHEKQHLVLETENNNVSLLTAPINTTSTTKSNDDKVYSYFSNSAKYNSSGSSSSSSDGDLLVLPNIDRFQYCKKCRTDIDQSYLNFMQDKDANSRMKSCFHCHVVNHKLGDKLCVECNVAFKKLAKTCDNCNKNKDTCDFCNNDDINYCPFCKDHNEQQKLNGFHQKDNILTPEKVFNNVSHIPIPKRYIDEENRLPKFVNGETDPAKRASFFIQTPSPPKHNSKAFLPLIDPKYQPNRNSAFKRIEAKWEVRCSYVILTGMG